MRRFASALLAYLGGMARSHARQRILPPPDTIEHRNAQSLARYYAQRAMLTQTNARYVE
jgi:hypothetical protein